MQFKRFIGEFKESRIWRSYVEQISQVSTFMSIVKEIDLSWEWSPVKRRTKKIILGPIFTDGSFPREEP